MRQFSVAYEMDGRESDIRMNYALDLMKNIVAAIQTVNVIAKAKKLI